MRPHQLPSENTEWRRARNAAFVEEVLATLTRRPGDLLSFDHVHEKLQLGKVRYLGLQNVSLQQIAGTVGRYPDFTRAFFPRKEHLQGRWKAIEQLVATGKSLPPVELYKVGEAFFVRDGHHRISVARHRGYSSIEALVWEYDAPVQLQPDSDIDELLRIAAHEAFLERTHIDRLCPSLYLELTQLAGYDKLLQEVEQFQSVLSRVEERELSPDEAVTLWCEMRYFPIIEIIRRRAILQDFPGRTETDLYLWLCCNSEELEEGYQQPIMMEEAASELVTRFGRSLPGVRQARTAVRWVLGGTAGFVAEMRRAWWARRKRR